MTPVISISAGLLAILALLILFVAQRFRGNSSRRQKKLPGSGVAMLRQEIAEGRDKANHKPSISAYDSQAAAPVHASAKSGENLIKIPESIPVLVNVPSVDQTPVELLDWKPLEEHSMHEEDLLHLTDMTDKIMRPKSIFTSLALGQLGPKELADVVASDPEIAAKMLRIVNSAAYGLAKKINSVQRAAIFLGTFLVRDISMRLCMQHSFKKGDQKLEAAYQKFWQASMLASNICQRLAAFYNLSEPSSLATRALLSFIGNLVILSNKPELALEYSSKSSLYYRTKYEEDILRCNAAVLGGMLARKWRLPDEIELGIKQSLVPMSVPPSQFEGDGMKELVICYLSCRLGEQLLFDKLNDIAQCTLNSDKSIEYFYIPAYLQACGFGNILETLQNTKIRNDINLMVQQINLQIRIE